MKVVTICGSMKYKKEMMKISENLELINKYVVIQCIYSTENKKYNEEELKTLAQIHRKKIDISDAIYVVNIDRYIGSSTKCEIEYAIKNNKEIIYHEN